MKYKFGDKFEALVNFEDEISRNTNQGDILLYICKENKGDRHGLYNPKFNNIVAPNDKEFKKGYKIIK